MTQNRIRDVRKAHGYTLETLAEKVGVHHSHLSRIEKGKRLLMIPLAEKIARELGVTPQEVMGYAPLVVLPSSPPAQGFSEDLTPYEPGKNDALAGLTAEGGYLFTVRTPLLAKAGILLGDIVNVKDSPDVCLSPPPLAAVRVRLHPADNFMAPVTLLRQFVPPRLLITNAIGTNATPIDMDEADAHIVGVVTSVHRRTAG